MAFSVVSKKSGKTYYLHARLQKLRGGQEVTLYYFAGQPGSGAIDASASGIQSLRKREDRSAALKEGIVLGAAPSDWSCPWVGARVSALHSFGGHMRVDLSRRETGVAEQRLHAAQICATVKQMGRETVAQLVWT